MKYSIQLIVTIFASLLITSALAASASNPVNVSCPCTVNCAKESDCSTRGHLKYFNIVNYFCGRHGKHCYKTLYFRNARSGPIKGENLCVYYYNTKKPNSRHNITLTLKFKSNYSAQATGSGWRNNSCTTASSCPTFTECKWIVTEQ